MSASTRSMPWRQRPFARAGVHPRAEDAEGDRAAEDATGTTVRAEGAQGRQHQGAGQQHHLKSSFCSWKGGCPPGDFSVNKQEH